MAELTPLQQVQEDAKRITLKRIRENEEAIAWQESKDGTVTFDESVEAAKPKEVKKPKAKKAKVEKPKTEVKAKKQVVEVLPEVEAEPKAKKGFGLFKTKKGK